jgi:hypothetical protein
VRWYPVVGHKGILVIVEKPFIGRGVQLRSTSFYSSNQSFLGVQYFVGGCMI